MVTLRRCLATVTVVAGLLAAAAPAATATSPSGVVPPKDYYLALGDSVAYGYEQPTFNAEYPNINPASFDTGYVDDFTSTLSTLSPGIQAVNDSCPGDTSDTFISGNPNAGFCGAIGGYPTAWLHHPYSGSQLAAAVAFLQAHSRQTSPVTIDIGGHDLIGLVNVQCNRDPACIQNNAPGLIGHIAANLATILAALRNAAPTTEMIVVGLYDPLFTIQGGDQLVEGAFNPALANVAAQYGARFADPFPAINYNEPASVCTLTYACDPSVNYDIHPNDAGYQAIANVVLTASGYHRSTAG